MSTELEEKTRRIAAMLDRENLDAVLLNAQHNFAWLTGGGSNGVDRSRENGVASLLVTRDGNRYVLASVIEIERIIEEELSVEGFDPIDFPWQGEKAKSSLIIEKAKAVLESGAKIASDLAISAAIPVIENKIAACRYQLTSNEIDRYRLLGSDAGSSIRRVIDNLSHGETEIEIAERMRHDLALGGMTSVVTLVAADERISRFRHPIPTVNSWKKTLLMVTCAKRLGLIVSLSRIVCVGGVPDELRKKTEATALVNAHMLDATRPGSTGSDIYFSAAKAYAESGFALEIDLHHQGGAAGYKTRDWVAHPQSNEVVNLDQAFAWNPSITGTKVEETVITTENGVDTITASPDFPQIVTVLNGRKYFSPGILSV